MDKADELMIKRLVKNNPTMRQRFEKSGVEINEYMRCESETLTGLILSLRVPLVKLLPNTYRRSRIKSKF